MGVVSMSIWSNRERHPSIFPMSSFFRDVSWGPVSSSPLYSLWKMKAPPRIIAFGWLALDSGVLTMNLCQQKRILINACLMCLADKETKDHLLLRRRVTQALWSDILGWFDYS